MSGVIARCHRFISWTPLSVQATFSVMSGIGGSDGNGTFTTNDADQEHAASLNASGAAASSSGTAFALFPACDVKEGTFKYVLIRASGADGTEKLLVRAGPGDYHADVAEPTMEGLRGAGLEATVLGGGRIAYDPAAAPPAPHVRIYGFSYGFGKADHAVSAEVCRAHFGADTRLEWSDEGY